MFDEHTLIFVASKIEISYKEKTAAKYRPLAKALRLFVQLDETQSHRIPFDLYIMYIR